MDNTNNNISFKTYPVIEDKEKEFNAMVERNYTPANPGDNKIITLGIGEVASLKELDELRTDILVICKKYGFGSTGIQSPKNLLTKMDKEIGELIYHKMNITPSVAATLPMWYFLNLYLVPDIIYWRWGDNKDHYISPRRNYLGTQWWRYHLFNVTQHTLKKYMTMSDRDIADLYERTNSRGLPEHIANISMWFEELDKNNVSGNSQELYREVLKKYNAQLAYRLYFALSTIERLEIFTNCYEECSATFTHS